MIDRPNPDVSVQALLALGHEHRPKPDRLDRVAATPGLAESWCKKLLDRAERLKGMA